MASTSRGVVTFGCYDFIMPTATEARRASGTQVPGLSSEAGLIARLSARSALYTDFQVLLHSRPQAMTFAEYRRAVLEENALARGSEAARKKVFQELKGRYILDAEHPLFTAFWQQWVRCGSDHERALTAYVLLALNDKTVAVVSMEWLFPHLRRAPSDLRIRDLEAFLQQLGQTAHPEVARWSPITLTRVAQHYLASIRDFGLATGTIRKIAHRPALYGSPVRLLLRALEILRVPPLQVVRHESFKILGIAPDEVIDALSQLNRQGDIRFRMQANVVELST
jgi:Putative inner membrane protein (DUF1819)